jgi:hypothetical protein
MGAEGAGRCDGGHGRPEYTPGRAPDGQYRRGCEGWKRLRERRVRPVRRRMSGQGQGGSAGGSDAPETSAVLTLLRESEYRAHVKEVNAGLGLLACDLRMPPLSRPTPAKALRSLPAAERASVSAF